jgi:hypothetical protein
MLTGIELLGTVTAAAAAWFVHIVRAPADAANSNTTGLITELSEKVDAPRAEVAELRPRPAPDSD